MKIIDILSQAEQVDEVPSISLANITNHHHPDVDKPKSTFPDTNRNSQTDLQNSDEEDISFVDVYPNESQPTDRVPSDSDDSVVEANN